MNSHILDRASSVPAYSQIANLLRRRIAEGEYRPGDAIPAVSELATRLGVASMTVRQAITQLCHEGLVVRRQGLGTFVLPPNVSSAKLSLDNLTKLLSDQALVERTLSKRQIAAKPQIAEKLAIKPGATVLAHKRVLMRHNKPVFYQSRYVRADTNHLFDDIEAGPDSLLGLFSGYSEMGIKNGQVTLHAAVLGKQEAALLQGKAGKPAWMIEYFYVDFHGHPVVWGQVMCRAELLSFSAPVGIADIARPTEPPTRVRAASPHSTK